MLIALLTQNYAPEFEGGTEWVVRAQARELAARGHRVRIVCGSERPAGPRAIEHERVDGIEVLRIARTSDEPYDLALDRTRVAQLVRYAVGRVDIVHVHHWSTLHGSLVRDLARRARVVVTLHDSFATCPRFFRVPPSSSIACPPRGRFASCAACIERDAPGRTRRELELALDGRAAAFEAELAAASMVIAPSRSHAERVAPLLGRAACDLRVIPHGLCRHLSRPSHVPRRKDGPLRLLHFGHLSAEKGALDLITMLGSLPAGAVELVLAGAIPSADFERHLRAMPLPPNVRIAERYDERALVALSAESDLALFPSRYPESYGLVVDEAIALGLPAWVSAGSGPEERIAELRCGRALPAGAPSAWAAALQRALDDPRELARERESLPLSLRSAADAARELEHIYSSLVARRAA